MSDNAVTIGSAAGAWGDTVLSTPQLLASGRCDYIIYEGLAEITMGILTRQKVKDPSRGYATDIIHTIADHLGAYAEQGIKVVTNAGGINPAAAAQLLRDAAAKAGIELRVASVVGDDLAGRLDELRDLELAEMTDAGPLPDELLSFNAYLGARPIVAALDAGADIVVTGRGADSALVLGPLIHEFGWAHDDWDKLSQGSLAGHLLECGPQSTGGLYTDWESFPSWADIGYPLAECRPDGSFVLTKPDDTGGLVTPATVAEQLLYEIGDPTTYLLPDVTCDWTQVSLAQVGDDRVEVTDARGRPAPPTLKACAQVIDGFKARTTLFVLGRNADRKAHRLAEDIRTRSRAIFEQLGAEDFREFDVEVIGTEATYGANSRVSDSREVTLKVGMAHDDERALRKVLRDPPSFGLAVPGSSAGGAVPRPTPRMLLRSYLVPRELIPASVEIDGEDVEVDELPVALATGPGPRPQVQAVAAAAAEAPTVTLPLIAIAHGRSGDKGIDANIGIRARHPDFLPVIRHSVTAERVAEHLAHLLDGGVDRYDLPGLDAVNLHLHDALGGGGIASLRIDPQGKAFAQQLLDLPIDVPTSWLDHDAIADVPEVAAARS
ncbi:MAG: acyclic terpene utilization AtuA family protein [Actinomycetota bacterium]